jgi:hypothetical protein
MGLVGKMLLFAARECARPCLEKIGEHVGDAIGTVIAKRIDPNHGAPADPDGDAPDKNPNDKEQE